MGTVTVPNRERLTTSNEELAKAVVQLATDINSGGSAGAADFKVRFATTANLTLSTAGLSAVDGVTPVAGDLALVKDQSTHSQNGIYVVGATAWTRYKLPSGSDPDYPGVLVQVEEGTVNHDLQFVCTTDEPVTVGTDAIDFSAAFAGSLSSATPAAVAATGAAGSAGTASKSDHAHADPMRGAAGTALTDTATQSIQISGGNWRKIGTISQDSVLTLAATGAAAGDQIDITRTDATSAHTYTVKDDAATTLFVMPNSKTAWARFQFDGTHFVLRAFGLGS